MLASGVKLVLGRYRALACAALVSLVLMMVLPASSGAQTFGTNLSQAPNAPLSCGQGVLNQFLLEFLYGPFGDSCTWTSVVSGNAAESLTAPGTGTVTSVSVRMGPSTGPMQVDVIRYLFQQSGNPASPYIACCFVKEYGPVFTPQANTVTTVQTNLPVEVQPTPPPYDLTTSAATDQLALTSLNPSVQVPLFATNGGSNDLSVLSYAWYPAPTSATVAAPSPNPIGGFADLSGFKVLMSAEFTPASGAPPPSPAPTIPPPVAPITPAPSLPMLTLPKLTAPVLRNTAAIPVQCLVAACDGSINLQNVQPGGAASAVAGKSTKKKVISYGSSRFSLKAGAKGSVKIKLNAAGRKLVKKHHKNKVWANITFSSGGGTPKSVQITLT